MEEYLMKIDGQNGCAMAYNDRVVISRNGIKGLLTQGFSGDRTYFYKDITAVDFRKPSFVANGYLKIITGGIQDDNCKKVNLIKSTDAVMKDPNTLALRAFKKETANKDEEFYNLIMNKINEIKNNQANTNNNVSVADELKKFKELLDMGAITEEEYNKKNKELFNL